jgi:hypothetical protein
VAFFDAGSFKYEKIEKEVWEILLADFNWINSNVLQIS